MPLPIEPKKTIITSGILLKVLIGCLLGKNRMGIERKKNGGKGDRGNDGETISAGVSLSRYIFMFGLRGLRQAP